MDRGTRSKNLIQPGPLCAPCVKEEICGPKAAGNIEAGHRLFRSGAWTQAEAELWNSTLDAFVSRTNDLLAAKMARPAEGGSS